MFLENHSHRVLDRTHQDKIDAVLDGIIENGFICTEYQRIRLDQLNGIPSTLVNFKYIIQWIEESLEGVDFVSNKQAIYMNSNRIGGFGYMKPIPNAPGYSLNISADFLSVLQRTHRLANTTVTNVIKKWMLDNHGLNVVTVTKLFYKS